MSIIETPTVDCVHQRGGGGTDHHRVSAKRKLDDYGPALDDDDNYADYCDLVSVRMRKDEPKAVNSCNSHTVNRSVSDVDTRISDAVSHACSSSRSQSTSSRSKLQFFVRMMPEGRTLVMRGCPQDTVRSIHERIQTITGFPLFEQRLIYMGKQLQWEQTLVECSIEKDSNLQLVGRMRSTEYPQAWQVINDMVSLIWRLCRGEMEHDALKSIKGFMTDYLGMTPRVDNDSVSGYFQIFMNASAPAVLVMLYMSPYTGNKECADSSIRHFMSSCCTALSKSMHTKCARVVLEFCKLLRSVASEDPLYLSCRSTFGSLLETAGIFSYGSESEKDLILIQDIFPFVCELANRLVRGLDMSIESPTSVGPSLSDVRDFTAFLLPLRTRIREQQACKGLYSSKMDGKRNKHLLLVEENQYLRHVFIDILMKMDQCLNKMGEILAAKERMEGDNLYSAWSQYLSILKELYHLSKLHDGAEEEFWSVLRSQRNMLIVLIIQYAKRTDDHQWLLEHKYVTNFESRRHLVMMMFPEVKEDYEELHEMLIDRSQLLAESFEYIARAEPESLHAGLFMEFKNEEATGPGVLREWFFLVCQAIFNPQNALFVACPTDRRRFLPNPASVVHPLHLEYFTFSGRVIALALMHRVQVGIVFDRVFFLQLAGKYVTLEDIRDADPYLYSSCKQILEMDADFIDSDALGLTFVREVEELGYRKVVELCPGGKSIAVNSKNRDKYVDLLIQDRFVTSISEQVSHFARGFADVLCNPRLQQFFFKSLDLEDLDWMLHGSENTISVEDWKTHTEYNGYKETDPQICWFWEIVGRMSVEQRKLLLFFWTSVKYLPVDGFQGLASRLYIYKSMEPVDRLPSSHTCFFRLCFPPYPSMSVMQDRLRIITQEHIGSSFGTW
ncbi:E3 ubiquitin-protein ligase UPL5 isoform X1 [Senna tora]|uniref:HECT-type E3 ubiquitin transferase n=1 Tax=Senna tora TaxID=362788 RepID=A0A834SK02_9FABA|nr:E3 ubiquitin-protein ligase UPL5 isoform X1 [Senna tora]